MATAVSSSHIVSATLSSLGEILSSVSCLKRTLNSSGIYVDTPKISSQSSKQVLLFVSDVSREMKVMCWL